MVCSHRDIASDIGLRAHPCEETDMPFYEKGDVRIRYEEAGSGFPLLLIPGGGLNSTISFFNGNAPVEEEQILANPAARVGKFIARSRTEVEIFTPEELTRLLQTTAEEIPKAYSLVLTLA
jgi:hypothetical protein